MANAPPHGDVHSQKSANRSPTKADQAGNVSRLKSNVKVGYGVSGDTGSSAKMPTGRATAPLVTGRGAKR